MANETFYVRIHASDPDVGRRWDPYLLIRVDWNGDGTPDTEWFFVNNQPGASLDLGTVYADRGTYQAVVEVRDGYLASSRFVQEVVVQ